MADLTLTKVSAGDPLKSVIEALPAGSASLAAGDVVRLDTATGMVVKAAGDDTATSRVIGVLLNAPRFLGDAVSVLRRGLLVAGTGLSGLSPDDPVYASDTDGKLGDDAADATVDVIVGRAWPIFGNGTSTPDIGLMVNCL